MRVHLSFQLRLRANYYVSESTTPSFEIFPRDSVQFVICMRASSSLPRQNPFLLQLHVSYMFVRELGTRDSASSFKLVCDIDTSSSSRLSLRLNFHELDAAGV